MVGRMGAGVVCARLGVALLTERRRAERTGDALPHGCVAVPALAPLSKSIQTCPTAVFLAPAFAWLRLKTLEQDDEHRTSQISVGSKLASPSTSRSLPPRHRSRGE